jgi:hypothetical protein
MPKVFAFHTAELKSGVKSEDFEKFYREEFLAPENALPGVKISLLQEQRDHAPVKGKYTLVNETESVERHKQLWPEGGEVSEEEKSREPLIKKFGSFFIADSYTLTYYVTVD